MEEINLITNTKNRKKYAQKYKENYKMDSLGNFPAPDNHSIFLKSQKHSQQGGAQGWSREQEPV